MVLVCSFFSDSGYYRFSFGEWLVYTLKDRVKYEFGSRLVLCIFGWW